MLRKRIKPPSREELEKELEETGVVSRMAERHSVSNTTMSNWLKRYGIKTAEQKIKGL